MRKCSAIASSATVTRRRRCFARREGERVQSGVQTFAWKKDQLREQPLLPNISRSPGRANETAEVAIGESAANLGTAS